MPEYLAPGVYIEETPFRSRSIEAVPTDRVGFLGETERGPVQPKRILSWREFQRHFDGMFGETQYLPYAVQGFFLNGGDRCYVSRILDHKRSQTAHVQFGNLTVRAIGPGDWGNRIAVRIDQGSSDNTFNLSVFYWRTMSNAVGESSRTESIQNLPQPHLSEEFTELVFEEGSPNSVEKVINNRGSCLITVHRAGSCTEIPVGKPLHYLLGGDDGEAVRLEYYQGSQGEGKLTGLTALEHLDDIAIVYVPNAYEMDGLPDLLMTHCEKRRDRFAILDVRQGQKTIDDLTPMTDRPSKHAAIYYPWLKILDPESKSLKLVPPGGHVAGIYARTDLLRGVHKAPANEEVLGALELEFAISDTQQDVLNPRGINVIRVFPDRGLRVWGARTLSPDPQWKYINVRRLFNFIEASIHQGTQWAVFEPNNETLWANVRRSIADFLRIQWRNGALQGLKEEEAFFVKADRTTMTQDDIENGHLVVEIGLATIKPAEFIIFRLALLTADSNR